VGGALLAVRGRGDFPVGAWVLFESSFLFWWLLRCRGLVAFGCRVLLCFGLLGVGCCCSVVLGA